MMKIKNYLIYFLQSVTNKIYNLIFLYFIAHTSNGLNKRRYMVINEIIEEEEEDNNNTKILKKNKNRIENTDEDNNIKKINNINIIKNDNSEYLNNKDFKNKKKNFLYKSVSASKENNEKGINYPSSEKFGFIMNKNNLNKKFCHNYCSTRDKIFMDYRKENNKKVELPSLSKNINISSNNNNISDTNKFVINNNMNESPSTSAFSHSNKKYLINDHNFTEEISKYRMGLLSANSSSNNTPIIPILPIKRPVSNFNFGGNPLCEIENISNQYDLNSKNNINLLNNKNNINIIGKNNFNKSPVVINSFNVKDNKDNNSKTSPRNKNIFKSFDLKGKSGNSSKYNNNLPNNINDNFMTSKMQKITIEKGMMNNKFTNTFNRQLINYNINSKTNNNIFKTKNENKSHSVKK